MIENKRIIQQYTNLVKIGEASNVMQYLNHTLMLGLYESMKAVAEKFLSMENKEKTNEQLGKTYGFLAKYYYIKKDSKKLKENIEEGIKYNDPYSMTLKGICLIFPEENNNIYEIDREKGLEYLKKGVEANDAWALKFYGEMLSDPKSNIVKQDYDEAIENFEKAFENGCVDCFKNIITLYVEKKDDTPSALRWAKIGEKFDCVFSKQYLEALKKNGVFDNFAEKKVKRVK